MTVKYQIQDIERDEIKIQWAAVNELAGAVPSRGMAGPMGQCGGNTDRNKQYSKSHEADQASHALSAELRGIDGRCHAALWSGLVAAASRRGAEGLILLISRLRLRCIVAFKPHDSRHDGRRPQTTGTLVAEGGVACFADFYGVSRSPRANYLARLEQG